MKNFTNGASLTLVGLIIAALGVISPIAWDWWNKRTQITIENKSNVSIVSISQPVKNLELLYNGKKISELRKVVLLVKNTGKIPVTKEDVISPLKLIFSADEVLEASATRHSPSNFNASVFLKEKEMALGFDLFNPGDETEIEVLVAGAYEGFNATARIKNISSIEVVDASNDKKSWKNLGLGAYISGFFGVVFLISGTVLLFEIPRKKISISLIKQGASPILKSQSPDEATIHLKNEFGFLTGPRARIVRLKIHQLNYPISDVDKEELASALINAIEREDSAVPAIFSFVIGGIASWYVVSSFMAL
jgi:hypothetical protein